MKLRTALLTLLVTPILITPAKALLVETEQQFLEGVVVYITKKQEFADELKAHFSKATDPNYEYDSKKTPRIICELTELAKDEDRYLEENRKFYKVLPGNYLVGFDMHKKTLKKNRDKFEKDGYICSELL
ncbi:Uncharacterised protein [Acinetobacter pittii]|uniref:hypothetical protein n=1 Tax=Acinetobacter pittii TaxID=48296 RepID=UPI000DE5D889|nr:hypothetical protein [Acinetobacter pittii]SSP30229.1 Uncharacterised protein [Acinetobacter pittii]